MTTERSVLLFTRDLRLHDNPALAAASKGPVLGLFVLDDRMLRATTMGPNRLAFLLESLEDLRAGLRERGGELFVRRGNPAERAVAAARRIGAARIHVSADVTAVARRRVEELWARAGNEIEVCQHDGLAVVPPGAVTPTGGGDHYRVFTPFWRAWSQAPRRALLGAPDALSSPDGLDPGELPSLESLAAGADPGGRRSHAPFTLGLSSPRRQRGGEVAARARLRRWTELTGYEQGANALGDDATSRLSAYLHFGCLSASELEAAALARRDGPPEVAAAEGTAAASVDAFVRQLCWRDFYLAVHAAFPALGSRDYRPRGQTWRYDAAELAAWKEGRTGVDLVDAAMRQLAEEGFVHNRARLVASSYLVKTLGHDWREGAAHYLYWLCDGDVTNNAGNWQWMAGTGNDTRPNRVLNPLRQAERFDPDGRYRRRYLGAAVAGPDRLPLG